MFQTEIIVFIQSFANEFWTFLFSLFSDIGRSNVITPLIIVITVGFNFRNGLIIMHTAFWSGILSSVFKEIFQLPRPANVDKAVQLLGEDYSNPTLFEGQGGNGFFGGLPRQVVEYLRAHRIDSFGFPSGHTSLAAGFWGALFLFFKQKWLKITALIFLIGIPFSRMYLGRHFLIDIMGGYALGAVVLVFFYREIYKETPLREYLFEQRMKLQKRLKDILVMFYFLVVPFLLLLIPFDSLKPGREIGFAAIMLGMNLAFILLWKRGLPKDTGTLEKRLLRVLLAVVLFFAVRYALKFLSALIFANEPGYALFIRYTLTFFLPFFGGVELAIALNLFQRENTASNQAQ